MGCSFRRLLTLPSCILMIIFFGGSKQMNNRKRIDLQQQPIIAYQVTEKNDFKILNTNKNDEMSIEDKRKFLSTSKLSRMGKSTAIDTYQIQIKHSTSNKDPVDAFLEAIGMIRDGYAEFGRQIAISVINVLVFAIETVVGIFIKAPAQADRISQQYGHAEGPKSESNNRRYQNPGLIDYYDPYHSYYDRKYLNSYNYLVPYDYTRGNYYTA